MENESLLIDKEALNEKDGVFSSYTDLNKIGLFTDSFRHKIDLHNGGRNREEAIVNGMMFSETNVKTGYNDAEELLFQKDQEIVIHRDPTYLGKYNISIFEVMGMCLVTIIAFLFMMYTMRKQKS